MKDKLKKYKHKTLGLETELVKRNNQVLVLEDAINVLKQQLQVSAAVEREPGAGCRVLPCWRTGGPGAGRTVWGVFTAYYPMLAGGEEAAGECWLGGAGGQCPWGT